MKTSRITRSILAVIGIAALAVMFSCGLGLDRSSGAGGGGTGGGGTGGPASSGQPVCCGTGNNISGIQAVNHIVYMIQENRSFDHYFSKLNEYRIAHGLPATVDETPTNPPPSNPRVPDYAPITPFHLSSMCIENTSADWIASHQNYNLFHFMEGDSAPATMDGFVWSAAGAAAYEGAKDIAGIRGMGYYDQSDLPYYYWLATQFGVGDRWYSPAPIETEPSKMYMVAATSAGHAHIPTAPVNVKTIFQSLDDKGLSWKIYATNIPSNAILNYFQPYATTHQTNIVSIDEYYIDVQNGTLPAVAMIENAYGSLDEHPGITSSIQIGAAQTAKIVNSLIASQSWKDTVFFIAYDENGGFYDHVPPPVQGVPNPDGISPIDLFTVANGGGYNDPPGDFNRFGFRVPNLVISPFSKVGFVSHQVTDSTGILKFIETRFGLPNLTKRDAAVSDLTDFFDWTGKPNLTPPAPPAQPVNGPCTDTLP